MTTSRSARIEAPAERVWELVSDLPGMGALSPENTGGTWRGGATGPAVGARFRGRNRNGWRRWSTTVRVTRCVRGRSFAFTVTAFGTPVSEWSYDLVPEGDAACTVTETWHDRRWSWTKPAGALLSGVPERGERTAAAEIEATLAALTRVAEASRSR